MPFNEFHRTDQDRPDDRPGSGGESIGERLHRNRREVVIALVLTLLAAAALAGHLLF